MRKKIILIFFTIGLLIISLFSGLSYSLTTINDCKFDLGESSLTSLKKNYGYNQNYLNWPPPGWTEVVYSGNGRWQPTRSTSYKPGGWDGSCFVAADSNNNPTLEFKVELFTPPVDLTGNSDVKLEYARNFQDFAGEDAAVNVYSGGILEGALWSSNEGEDPSSGLIASHTIDPSTFTFPNNVYFGFFYDTEGVGHFESFSIDDVKIKSDSTTYLVEDFNIYCNDDGESFIPWADGGDDTFDSTSANVRFKIRGIPFVIPVSLSGPTTVNRLPPEPNPDGKWEIPTEIIQMELESPRGTVIVSESPVKESTGSIKQVTPGNDFPAESFFDVYVEVEMNIPFMGDVKLHNKDPDPVKMNAIIYDIPPYNTIYIPPTSPDIPLYTENGLFSLIPLAWIMHANHTTSSGPEDREVHINISAPLANYLYIFGLPFYALPSDIPTIILGPVLIHAIAESGVGIERVGFSIDGGGFNWVYYPPYIYIWSPPFSIGFHSITATAYNTMGDSASQSIEVISAWISVGGDED